MCTFSMIKGTRRRSPNRIPFARSSVLLALSLSVLAGSAGLVAADTVEVMDSRGKNVLVQRPVKSVAIFPLPIPEAMIALDGGTKRLSAINPRAKTALLNGVVGQIFPEIAAISTDLVAGNFTPNVEEILRVKPDVIVQWDTNAGVRVEPMENAGLKVATASSATREARRAYITMLGKILGKEGRAQSFLDWDDAVFADIASTLKGVAQPDRKRIVFIDSMNGNELVVFGQQQVYFDAGGLRNAPAEAGLTDGSVKVSAETLLSWKPDIVLVNYYNDSIKPEDTLNHPVLSGLDAVKQRRVYKTPAIDPATSAGGQLTYLWFAEIGYPDLFHADVRSAILDGFARLYDAKLTPAQLDALLQMSWNGKSAGYAASFAGKP